MKWGFSLTAICLLVLGFTGYAQYIQRQHPEAAGTPTFEASIQTDEDPGGIRNAYRTTYTYYQKVGNQKRELWRITLNEKPVKHWIAPNGNLWVLTEQAMRHRIANADKSSPIYGRLWVRDPQANELVSITEPFSTAFRQSPHNPVPPVGHGLSIETGKISPFRNGTQIQFAGSNGRLHITEMAFERGYRYITEWLPKSDGESALSKFLESDEQVRVDTPVLELPNWIILSYGNQFSKAVLIVGDPHGRNLRDNVVQAHLVREWPIYPAHIEKTPNGNVLLYTFGHNGVPNEASIEAFDPKGWSLGKIDLIKDAKFESIYQAQHSLRFKESKVLRDSRWVPLATANPGAVDGAEQIEIHDDRNHRFIVSVPTSSTGTSKLSILRMSGETPTPAKEQKYGTYAKVGDSIYKAPGGKYYLRQRTLKDSDGKRFAVQTLIFRESRINNEIREHEIWSAPLTFVPKEVIVSDGGRVFSIFIGDLPDHTGNVSKQALLLSRRVDSHSSISLDLTSKNLCASIELASQATFKSAVLKSHDPRSELDFNGVDLPQNAGDSIDWQLPGGRHIELVFSPMPAGNIDRMYWITK